VWRRDYGHGAAVCLGTLGLQVPGRHSVSNALAAIAVGLELDVPFARIASALHAFKGAERRFQQVGRAAGVTVIDDYGHHPTEIAVVLAAARAARPRRVVVAFQPHRYSRTRDLLTEFADVLSTADEVILTDIYPAGENPIPGVTIEALADAINVRRSTPVHLVHAVSEVAAAVAAVARDGDLVLTLGAGSIGGVAPAAVAALAARDAH
jgi:UDP-N-acetylmuramate--alanine ligase